MPMVPEPVVFGLITCTLFGFDAGQKSSTPEASVIHGPSVIGTCPCTTVPLTGPPTNFCRMETLTTELADSCESLAVNCSRYVPGELKLAWVASCVGLLKVTVP